MASLAPIRIQRRLLLPFIGATILLLIIAGLPSYRLRVEKESSVKLTLLRKNIDAITSVLSGLIDMETGVRGYLITKDRTYLKPYYLGQKQLRENVPKLDAIPNHQKELRALKALVNEQAQISKRLITKPDEKLGIDRQKQLMDAKRLLLTRLQTEEESERLALLRRRQAAWAGDLSIGLIVLASAGFLLFFVQRWLRELIESQINLELALAAEHEARIGQERLAAQSRDLVTLAGHELGSPLIQIRIALEAASRVKGANDKSFEKLYNLGMAGITQIKAIRDEVLELQRSIELPVKPERFDLQEWCFNLALELDIERIKVMSQPGTMETDKTLLRRTLFNILDNALKYSSKAVGFRCLYEGKEGTLSFIIKDKGVGIPPEYLYKDLWKPFVRGRNVINVAPGEGLGLLTAKKSIERLGGMIAIASSEGVGTEVIVKLPNCVVE